MSLFICDVFQTDSERRRRISRLRRIQRGEDVSDDEYEASSNPADDAYLVRYTRTLRPQIQLKYEIFCCISG